MINKNSKIFVAGHKGLVGSAIIRKLISQGYKNILFEKRKNLDLTNQSQVLNYIKKKKTRIYLHCSGESRRNFIKL